MTSDDSKYFNFDDLAVLSHEDLMNFLSTVTEVPQFVDYAVSEIIKSNSLSALKITASSFLIHQNSSLRSHFQEYFGLPIFTNLSQIRLSHEIENSDDKRLQEAVLNISTLIKNDPLGLISKQANWLKDFVRQVLDSSDPFFINDSIKFFCILLLQPSCRRFVRSFMEDTLFISTIKTKHCNSSTLTEFDSIYFYNFNEVLGVNFASADQLISEHSLRLKLFQSRLLDEPELNAFSRLSYLDLMRPHLMASLLASHSINQLGLVLNALGNASFEVSKLDSQIAIDSIVSSLVLRPFHTANISTVYPTESSIREQIQLRPLTTESLSMNDLFLRHQKLHQANLFSELSSYINENISACKPILNRVGRTELCGWTRNSAEIISSAIVKTGNPDILSGGQYQNIELEVSISLAPLDQVTQQSWISLKQSDVVFVCRVDALENGEYNLKSLKSVRVESKTFNSQTLTFRLLVDPVQYYDNLSSDIFGNLNFILKRHSAESNDVRILQSLGSILSQNTIEFPGFLEDVILGICDPNEAASTPGALSLNDSSPLNNAQKAAISKCLGKGVSICMGPYSSGCSTVLKTSVHELSTTSVILCRSGAAIDQMYNDFIAEGIPEYMIVRLGFSSNTSHLLQKYNQLAKSCVERINSSVLDCLNSNMIYTCREAEFIFKGIVEPRWQTFQALITDKIQNVSELESVYPFSSCFNYISTGTGNLNEFKNHVTTHYLAISNLFEVAIKLAPLELLQSNETIIKYVFEKLVKVVLMTSTYAAINKTSLLQNGLHFSSLFVDDCHLIPEVEVLITILSQKESSKLERLCLFGHVDGIRPQVNSESLKIAGAQITLLDRFLNSGFEDTTVLEPTCCQSPWSRRSDSNISSSNGVFKNCLQFINVEPILGKGEEIPTRNYIQNLDEAEFAVALFQLLRLNNVASADVAIITAYKGQVDLIEEILESRCGWTEFYGRPVFIGTIDQSSGLSLKNVIVSLVRTKTMGFLSDSRRLDMAVSRASENLILLGSHRLFFNEETSFFHNIPTGPFQLQSGHVLKNVEEISKYVYELSVSKLNQ